MIICFSVWTYFNGYYYHTFYKRKSLFPQYESFPSLILKFLHTLHCVFHYLAHPWCLSYLSFFLCQSKSSVSLPHSHSLLLGTVFFFPCFLPWSQLSLLFSLSALLPLFSPVFLRIFFPSLPIPTLLTQLSQQHAFGAKQVPNFNSHNPLCRRWLHTDGQTWLCHHLMLQPHFLPCSRCLSFFARLHPCHLLPFLSCQTVRGWNGCSIKKVSAAPICMSRGAKALTTGTLP